MFDRLPAADIADPVIAHALAEELTARATRSS